MEDPNNILIIFGLVVCCLLCLKALSIFTFILTVHYREQKEKQSKKEIAQRVKELLKKENEGSILPTRKG
jgi:biopolymer transport protein ExbB/TolQ